MSLANLISESNPVFRAYAIYTGILAIKLLCMAFLTGRQRFAKKVFANPEDAKGNKGKVILNDPDVERVRRAHLNDLENIPVFWIVSFLYVLTNPSAALAVNLFRVFTGARIVHTLVYAVWVVPQPARALAFFAGLLTTVYMAFSVIIHFCV